jgi:hypothetical protein
MGLGVWVRVANPAWCKAAIDHLAGHRSRIEITHTAPPGDIVVEALGSCEHLLRLVLPKRAQHFLFER